MSANQDKNIASSVKNRLLAAAREGRKPFQSLLTHYALERFLFRLSRSPLKEKFILKGGLLLAGMGLSMARTTRDIDFLGLFPGNSDAVGASIRDIGNVHLDDGLVYKFDNLSIEAMSDDQEYPGIRLKFEAWLGKAKIPMQIDVGFGDAMVPAALDMTYPTLLDMEPPVVKAYSVETIVAEKFEASLDLAELNSRMKDFYDIWILNHEYPFQGAVLQESITATCTRRSTPLSSRGLVFSKEFADRSDKQAQWTTFLRKTQITGIPEDFPVIMEGMRKFLHPVAEASEKQMGFEKEWLPGGPWQS
ncbi:MAG: nucleotidyl transferase AbiEii/AbiGii toxin family protein [Smithellaceae bacterium]|jgi:predicted nucleotidyltransferase component of viral defense system|nr:nucleotidyl transferase AbiEii/AbiGii toxin family protein [Smithellaceae bacterium]